MAAEIAIRTQKAEQNMNEVQDVIQQEKEKNDV